MNEIKSNWAGGFTKPPQSYWMASVPPTDYPALQEDIRVDVAIIGGGMTGITTAYLLKKEGLKVAILEADRILHGTTGHTTAKITSQHGLIYHKIKKKMDIEKAQQYAQANESAIDLIESLVKEKNIDCNFHRCPAYVYTQENKYIQQIQDEVDTASNLGIRATYLEEIPLPFKVKAAMRFDNQARFHPLKYLMTLAKEVSGDGSQIYEMTRAIDIHQGESCVVSTKGGSKVYAEKVFVASHYPFYDGHGLYFTRLFPYRSYLLGVRIKGDFPDGMFITAEDPGRSLRSQEFEGDKLILVGGEHHKTGHGEDTGIHYKNLQNFAEQNFELLDIPYRWSTHDYTSADQVPYVGHITSDTSNIYVATGFRKWGMTNSTASAMIIKDMIVKGQSPWESVYNPSRLTIGASAGKFIAENADVAVQLVTGKLSSVPHEVEIEPGEAKVVKLEGQKVGIYKDEKGKVHTLDITCTHLRCELQWNSAERSWDCPCHGSRFTYEGEIIEGPALEPLKRIQE